MQINDKLTKKVQEVNYLRAENADRYRLIMRYFLLEYEKIHYWLNKEEIYQQIHQLEGYNDYTIDQCLQDLQVLVSWDNLTARQDSSKVRTIEDFKNRKYRYQLNEYSIRIERLMMELENLDNVGASLEASLLERIYQQLIKLTTLKDKEQIHGCFKLIMEDFIKLNHDYQEYFKTLNSAKAEELMKSTEFLIYKDKLVMYLRSFVMMMQDKGNLILMTLKQIKESDIEYILKQAAIYEVDIPRIDKQLKYDDVLDSFKQRWYNLYYWFCGDNGPSEMDEVYDITNDIIRRITRYAQQISEQINRGSNRKEQYLHIAKIFNECNDIYEAHCMSAYVFGVADCLHLDHIRPRISEDMNVGVYNEESGHVSFDGHSRIVRKKYIRKPASDYNLERKMHQMELEDNLAKQRAMIEEIMEDDVIDFAKLPLIDETVRKVLLSWLSKALAQESRRAKSDYGRVYYIDSSNQDVNCILKCSDGDFIMPAFRIVFEKE